MEKYLVSVPVADLRKEPVAHKFIYEKDPLQESQLIFGEKVIGLHEKEGWVFVEAIEQKKWSSEKGWKGYPGWVQKRQLQSIKKFSDHNYFVESLWQPIYEKPETMSSVKYNVPLGVALTIVDELIDHFVISLSASEYGFTPKRGVRQKEKMFCRKDICEKGMLFLDAPYLWGGRSAFVSNLENGITSVDCSGLTNLLYRINGKEIPRDAHDQFLKCTPKDYDDLEPGDLIFSADIKRPERMTHVMIHISPEVILESSLAPRCVRKVSMQEKFGVDGKGLKNGFAAESDVIYFGVVN